MTGKDAVGPIGPILVTLLMLTCCLVTLAPRTEAIDIKTLTGGASEASLVFQAAGKNTTQSLTVPKGAIVSSATLDIEGLGLQAPNTVVTDFDFNDSVNNKAWWGASKIQASGLPSTYEANPFVPADYPNVAKSDDVYVDTTNIQNEFAYHHFSFFVPATGIVSIKVFWEGGGVATGMIGNGGAFVYIFNNLSSQWEQVGNFACGDVWCERTITNTFSTNPDNYLDGDKTVHVIAVTRSAGVTDRITTDFVKITVTGRPLSFPKDPTLDVGDDGDNEWSYTGTFSSKATVTGAVLVSELNERIVAAGQGQGNAVITVAVTAGSAGIIRISNILVQYAPDDPPNLMMDIPSNWSLKEDTDAPGLINLYTYFHDDQDAALTFTIINKSAPKLLDATIGNNGKMSFTTPTENWWGMASFIVRAADSKGQHTDSDRFNVTVTSVNDPPVFDPIPKQHIKERTPYHFFIHATDVDIALNPNEHITYSSEKNRLVTANALTGEVTLVDVNDSAAVGSVIPDFSLNFSASDSGFIPSVTNVTVNFSVENLEFPPVLEHIGNKTLREGDHFSQTVKATDLDTKDVLTFSSQGDLFNISSSGKIDFTARQEDVGNHTMVLKVSDGQLDDTDTVIFHVINVNDAPMLGAMPAQKADNRHEFVYKVPAKDKDLGYDPKEALTFSSDSIIFKINATTGEIRFRPTAAMAGTHSYKITVVDRQGLEASGTLTINISLVNSPPVVTVSADRKMPVKGGQTVRLTAVATDPDTDSLTYRWYKVSDPGTTLGTNATLDVKAQKSGKVGFGVEVSDGIAKADAFFTVSVTQEKSGIPGFDLGPAVVAVALVAMMLVSLRRRR
jgi:hypothetical protein